MTINKFIPKEFLIRTGFKKKALINQEALKVVFVLFSDREDDIWI